MAQEGARAGRWRRWCKADLDVAGQDMQNLLAARRAALAARLPVLIKNGLDLEHDTLASRHPATAWDRQWTRTCARPSS